jgi:hypothetical protein
VMLRRFLSSICFAVSCEAAMASLRQVVPLLFGPWRRRGVVGQLRHTHTRVGLRESHLADPSAAGGVPTRWVPLIHTYRPLDAPSSDALPGRPLVDIRQRSRRTWSLRGEFWLRPDSVRSEKLAGPAATR